MNIVLHASPANPGPNHNVEIPKSVLEHRYDFNCCDFAILDRAIRLQRDNGFVNFFSIGYLQYHRVDYSPSHIYRSFSKLTRLNILHRIGRGLYELTPTDNTITTKGWFFKVLQRHKIPVSEIWELCTVILHKSLPMNYSKLSKLTGRSRNALRKTIKELIFLGWITVDGDRLSPWGGNQRREGSAAPTSRPLYIERAPACVPSTSLTNGSVATAPESHDQKLDSTPDLSVAKRLVDPQPANRQPVQQAGRPSGEPQKPLTIQPSDEHSSSAKRSGGIKLTFVPSTKNPQGKGTGENGPIYQTAFEDYFTVKQVQEASNRSYGNPKKLLRLISWTDQMDEQTKTNLLDESGLPKKLAWKALSNWLRWIVKSQQNTCSPYNSALTWLRKDMNLHVAGVEIGISDYNTVISDETRAKIIQASGWFESESKWCKAVKELDQINDEWEKLVIGSSWNDLQARLMSDHLVWTLQDGKSEKGKSFSSQMKSFSRAIGKRVEASCDGLVKAILSMKADQIRGCFGGWFAECRMRF